MVLRLMRSVAVVCLFISACGVLVSEFLLIPILSSLSPHLGPFCLSVLLCWLVLDNITLALDLARALVPSRAESFMFLRLRVADQRVKLISARIDDEVASHGKTAEQLDILQERLNDGFLLALHWGLLASKVVVMARIERMATTRKDCDCESNRNSMFRLKYSRYHSGSKSYCI